MPKTIQWMKVVVQCKACQKTSNVVLGTKTKEEKPIAKCPLCKSDQIQILSVTPSEGAVS
jgi:Zn finger protein HypA/HybF involved in hydrogenase expression